MRHLIVMLGILLLLGSTSCATSTRVVHQPKKVVVVKRPAKYKVVRVKGKRYYYWNGRYHKRTRKGFVLVKF